MKSTIARGTLVALLLVGAMAVPVRAARSVDDFVTYEVHKGDTLYALAQTYLIGLSAIPEVRAANRVRIAERMPVGLRLTIPRRLLKFRPIELRLLTFSGPVTFLVGNKTLAPQKGMVLREGGGVQTGANGFAVLAGSEGSRLALPSNSSVRLVRARNYLLLDAPEIEVAVDRGRVEVQAAKQKPDGRFRLRTPVAVSAVRGTVFRGGYDGARGSGTTEVTEGEVAVAAAKTELTVPAGFGAAADASGDLSKEELLRAPVLTEPGKVQTDAAVQFVFAPVTGASGYRVQVSRDAGFMEVIGEKNTAAPAAEFDGLANGTMFVRAAAISGRGLLGLEVTSSFRRQRLGVLADSGKAEIPGGFRINWIATGDGKQVYRFQLFAKDNPGQPVFDEGGLDEPGVTLVNLPKGGYRWRVGVIEVSSDGSAEVWTPFNNLTISN